MALRSFLFAALTLTSISGCATYVSESRMMFVPPREPACALEFVQTKIEDLAPGGAWQILGYVVVSETGVADPFAEKYRAMVRPRACAMGGEAVTLMQAATGMGAFGAQGSSINYAVIRRPSSEQAKPTSF